MEINSLNKSMSPCVLNMSNQINYLMPGGNAGRNFSPMYLNNQTKTPNLSPIIKPSTPLSESKFLRRRDAICVKERIASKSRRRTCFDTPINTITANPILEQTISVESTLKELKLEHIGYIFEREEINTMAIFFTLTNGDLELIGIEDEMDRKKILDFINSIKTPIKAKSYRH